MLLVCFVWTVKTARAMETVAWAAMLLGTLQGVEAALRASLDTAAQRRCATRRHYIAERQLQQQLHAHGVATTEIEWQPI